LRTNYTLAKTLYATNNSVSGIPQSQLWSDTSIAGFIRSDFNSGERDITSDGNYTHLAGGFNPQDAGYVKFTGTLSTTRTFTLDTTLNPNWVKSFILANASSSAQSFTVTNGSGGPTLKSVAQNTWAKFTVNQAGTWSYVGGGTL